MIVGIAQARPQKASLESQNARAGRDGQVTGSHPALSHWEPETQAGMNLSHAAQQAMGLKFRASNSQVTCSLGVRTCKAHSPGTRNHRGIGCHCLTEGNLGLREEAAPAYSRQRGPGDGHISAAGVPTALSAPVLKAAPPPGAPFSHLQSPPSAFPLLVAIRCCQPVSWSEVFPVDSSVSVCDQFVFHPVFVSHLWLSPEEAHLCHRTENTDYFCRTAWPAPTGNPSRSGRTQGASLSG
uniref:Uncharacterized protein n=1 Tax=Myotis myotis TaxID=51298 RepID=A0A7J7UPT1_MYOMY|nr:hypothetical protein mMyoMyo1_008559 [Myotis myotis]